MTSLHTTFSYDGMRRDPVAELVRMELDKKLLGELWRYFYVSISRELQIVNGVLLTPWHRPWEQPSRDTTSRSD